MIKFRAWDTKDKKYLFSDKQEFICTTHPNGLGVTIPFDIDGFIDPVQGIDWSDADLITGRYELEQFTGVTDTNGKEIYTGDIVRVSPEFEPDIEDIHNGEVVFAIGYGAIMIDYHDYDLFDELLVPTVVDRRVAVVGNIHENEELLHEDTITQN